MFVKNETIYEHFKKPVKSFGRGRFVQKNRDLHYKVCWQKCNFFFDFFIQLIENRMSDNTNSSFLTARFLQFGGIDDLNEKI